MRLSADGPLLVLRGRWAGILEEGQRLGTVRSDIVAEDVCLLGLGVRLTAGSLQAPGGHVALAKAPAQMDPSTARPRPPLTEHGHTV